MCKAKTNAFLFSKGIWAAKELHTRMCIILETNINSKSEKLPSELYQIFSYFNIISKCI